MLPSCNEKADVPHRQSYEPLEIIIVDDGSTDTTRQVVRALDPKIRYRWRSNGGPAAAYNMGLKMARGDVIAFLNSDDLWAASALESRLARLTSASETEPAVDIVLGLTQRVVVTRGGTGCVPPDSALPPWASMLFASAVFRKSVFEEVGLLEESLRFGEDVDWFFRAREYSVPMAFIKRITLLYRLHQGNMTNDTRVRDVYFLKAIKRSLDRRRRAGRGRIQELPDPANLQEMLEFLRPSALRHPAPDQGATSEGRGDS
jgi:glycosyltransferase involved in cell wall biosynthesis